MEILLTNDDGIYAEGLLALYRSFSRNHSVTVVAPDRERSGVGHGISLDSPLRAKRVAVNGEYEGYAVNGTPADCVKLGVLEILKDKPSVVLSGINPGANLGVNLNYSGTVAAAKEAALFGIPAIAASIRQGKLENYDVAARFIETLIEKVLENGLPFGTFLNVNIPNSSGKSIEGIVITRQGITRLSESFEKRTDPWQQTYYWQRNDPQSSAHAPDVDGAALHRNYISITPVKCDMTDYPMVESLKSWDIDKMDWG